MTIAAVFLRIQRDFSPYTPSPWYLRKLRSRSNDAPMTGPPDAPSVNSTPDESRLFAPSKTLLRISAILDFETVLRATATCHAEWQPSRRGPPDASLSGTAA